MKQSPSIKFKVGDIVQYKENPALKYVVTAIGRCSDKPTWMGLSSSGHINGGTIFGSWDFDSYKVIGDYPIKSMYEFIDNCKEA